MQHDWKNESSWHVLIKWRQDASRSDQVYTTRPKELITWHWRIVGGRSKHASRRFKQRTNSKKDALTDFQELILELAAKIKWLRTGCQKLSLLKTPLKLTRQSRFSYVWAHCHRDLRRTIFWFCQIWRRGSNNRRETNTGPINYWGGS
jgi:hypothetical protein